MAEQEEDYSALPIETRATHKIWKVRLAAYEDMKASFSKSGHESDECFKPFLDDPNIFKKIVTDTNVVAQETGLAALVAFLEFGGSQCCLRLRSHVVPPMLEKTMGSTRTGTKQNSIDALLFFIELDVADPVIEEMIPVLSHKTPKVVTGTTHALVEIIKAYGAKTVPCKLIIQALPALFSHADKNVRAEAQLLSIELYKWLGDSFKEMLFPSLKPVRQKDLEAEFEKVKGATPQQTRFLKSQRESIDRLEASGIDASNGNNNAEDEDNDVEMDLYDPVEVLSKIPMDYEKRVSSTKWQERKEILEEIFAAVNIPRLEEGEYGDIVRILAKCMKDANIQVVTIAANVIEALAKGLKSYFARYVPVILSPVLERLKEKKASISEALGKALDAIFNSSSLSEVLEETVGFLKHKTPQVKIETAKFLTRCLSNTRIMPSKMEIKLVADAGVIMLSDMQEPVRTEAAHLLGTLMKLTGERAMIPFLEGVDDIKKGKIKDAFETAEVKAKPGKAAPSTAAAPANATSSHQPPSSSSATASRPRPGVGGKPVLRKKLVPAPANGATAAGPASKLRTAGGLVRRPGAGSTNSPLKPRSEPSVDQSPSSSSSSQQLHPTVVPTRTGLTGRTGGPGGLTNRPIASQVRGGPASGASAPGTTELGISVQERQELDKLRAENQELQKEREHLQWQVQGFNSEKMALMQEINNLQFKNAQLVDEHTRDVVSIKSKETQLVRAQSDLTTARDQLATLKRENESLRARATDQHQPLHHEQQGVVSYKSMFGGNNGGAMTSPLRHSYLESPRRKVPTAVSTSGYNRLDEASHHTRGSFHARASSVDDMDVDSEGLSGETNSNGTSNVTNISGIMPPTISRPSRLPRAPGFGLESGLESGSNTSSNISSSSNGNGGLASTNVSDWQRETKRTEQLKDRLKQIQQLQQRSEERRRMKEEMRR